MSQSSIIVDSAAVLRAAQEIGALMLTARDETTLQTVVIGRLAQALRLAHAALLLYTGDTLVAVTVVGGGNGQPSPLSGQLALIGARMRDADAGEVRVLTPGGGLDTLVLVPLLTHGAPMGVIALGDAAAVTLPPAAQAAAGLVGQLLAGGLREMRLQARLDAANRQLHPDGPAPVESELLDPLTGLANAQRLQQELQRTVGDAVSVGGQVSLLYVDIDHFAIICQRYGEKFGDGVLARVAEVTQKSIRGRDLAARVTDDLFGVLLPNTPGLGAVVVAERLRERLSSLDVYSPDGEYHLTVSIGVACLSPRVTTPEQLVAKTDTSLRDAKALLGNQIMFDWDEAVEKLENG
jgi:diguanylate cyclase (GGDEF)-like protein